MLDGFLMRPLGKGKYKATLNQPFLTVQIRTRTARSQMKPLTLRNWNQKKKKKIPLLRFNLEAKIRPRTWLPPCCFRGLRVDPLSGEMGTENGRGARFRSEDLAMAASLWGRQEANRPAIWGRREECYCWATQKAFNSCALDLPDHFLNQFCYIYLRIKSTLPWLLMELGVWFSFLVNACSCFAELLTRGCLYNPL